MDILENLNPEQRMAVEHVDGPLLVVAGAGTGKTQVITRRIAYLIEQQHAKPHEILALTFTEKAAREMQDRLYALIGWQSFQIPVMTFHAFGTELLGRFASHIGRSIRGGLLNDTQKTLLLQQHLGRVSLQYYGPQVNTLEFLEGIVRYIGELQNAGVSAEDYEVYVAGIREAGSEMHPRDIDEQADLAALYRLYETVKAETGTFDHNDQLQLPLEILQSRPNVAQRLAKEYCFVLVDEYQDTNNVQDALLRSFIGSEGNIFAVGDDDQAIYGFRGAEIGNILAFTDHFRLRKPVVLIRNYRSGQAVLDASYRLIRHNDPERLEAKLGISKRLLAQHDMSTVSYVAFRRPYDEQEATLEAIRKRIEQSERPSGIAVLAATHAPLKALAKMMRTHGVPFSLATRVSIFEQPELLNLWYLMKWLAWQADEASIGHVMLGPFIAWPADMYRGVLERSRDETISIEEVIRASAEPAALELMANLEAWRLWARELPVSQLAFRLVFETGLAERLRAHATTNPRMVRVFEDFQRLLEQMQDYETVAFDTTLLGYFDVFPKPPELEVSEPTGEAEGVQLLTVHAAKGLEFETVYLIGCTQRSWAGNRTATRLIPEELYKAPSLPPEHEFRRLMYVAVTRARQSLVVSSATQTAGGSSQAVSPFISELFERLVMPEPIGGTSDRLLGAMSNLQRFYPMHTMYADDKLPFEDSEGWVDLSVTALGGYEFCPFEFYTENVLRICQPMGPQVAFGSALHQVFERYYRARLSGQNFQPDALHAFLDESWSARGYARKDIAEADKALAHETLRMFLLREEERGDQILASELPIRFEVPEAKLRLRGKIDALFQTEAGLQIRDFKTGRTKTDKAKLTKLTKDNFQLRTYALAYEALNGAPPAEVSLDYVVTGIQGVAALSAAILKNHRTKLIVLADKIRGRDFAPNPSPMHTCAAIRYYGTGESDQLFESALLAAGQENTNA